MRSRRLDRANDFLGLFLGTKKPVRRPDAMQDPAVRFQHSLPEAISVSRRPRRVIFGAVAFDPKQKTPRLVGIDHCEVNEESGGADLRLDVVTQRPQPCSDLLL